MGAISTSEDGTTSLSKMDSPRFPTVCVRSSRLPAPAGDEGEDEMSGRLQGAAINPSSSYFVLGKKSRRRVETLALPPQWWDGGGAALLYPSGVRMDWMMGNGKEEEVLKCKILLLSGQKKQAWT
jgi:hypothetical protein